MPSHAIHFALANDYTTVVRILLVERIPTVETWFRILLLVAHLLAVGSFDLQILGVDVFSIPQVGKHNPSAIIPMRFIDPKLL